MLTAPPAAAQFAVPIAPQSKSLEPKSQPKHSIAAAIKEGSETDTGNSLLQQRAQYNNRGQFLDLLA